MERSLAELIEDRNPPAAVDLPRMRCGQCNWLLRRVPQTDPALHCAKCKYACPRCHGRLVIRPAIGRTWHCSQCRSLQQFIVHPYVVED